MSKAISMVGNKYGKLLILEDIRESYDNNRPKWSCRCLCDCGNEKIISRYSILKGHSQSCGCYKNELSALRLHKTRAHDRIEAGNKFVFAYYKTGAKRRSIYFGLSFEEFKDLINKPCFYCGSEPSNKMTNSWRSNSEYTESFVYQGIDRVSSSKGYELDNCVPCCKTCNIAKMSMTQDEFKSWVNRIYNHWGSL